MVQPWTGISPLLEIEFPVLHKFIVKLLFPICVPMDPRDMSKLVRWTLFAIPINFYIALLEKRIVWFHKRKFLSEESSKIVVVWFCKYEIQL